MREERERIICAIEHQAKSIIESGALEAWHRQTPTCLRRVAGDANGPLLEVLADRIAWPDKRSIDFFRKARDCAVALALRAPVSSASPSESAGRAQIWLERWRTRAFGI